MTPRLGIGFNQHVAWLLGGLVDGSGLAPGGLGLQLLGGDDEYISFYCEESKPHKIIVNENIGT